MNVFLSHSNHADDQHIVDLLELGFRLVGVNLYIAERDPQPGKSLSEKLKTRIDASDGVLVLYTTSAPGSKEVNWEIGHAGTKKRIYFICEWGVEKPLDHQGDEHFPLERDKLVESICSVCIHFKPHAATAQDTRQTPVQYGLAVVDATGNPNYKFRIRYPKGHDLTLSPEYVTGRSLCSPCNLLLEERRNTMGYSLLKCPSCEKEEYEATLGQLRAKAISDFIKGGTWRTKQ